MCGIVGYTGPRQASDVIIGALKRLEYRGYDSAGIAIASDGIALHKDKGQVAQVEATMPDMRGGTGIGHTRWATCGEPSKANAHPFIDPEGRFALIHNGIVENHIELRRSLEARGHVFTSETDTEVLVHLISERYDGDMGSAMRSALREIEGTYALVMIESGSDTIHAARSMSPLIVGVGAGEGFLASDVTAMVEYTDRVVYIEDGETIELSPRGLTIRGPDGSSVDRSPSIVDWTIEDAQKGGFEHYMLKEIFEQPDSLRNTIVAHLDDIEGDASIPVGGYSSVKIVACGSSYHAGLVGKYLLEGMACMPTVVELASEYRYSACAEHRPLVILISQSGETTDTLAACREARSRGCQTLAITNVVGSTLTREAGSVMYTMCGPEIGVAATKSFTGQLAAMMLVAMRLGAAKGTIAPSMMRELKRSFRNVPQKVRVVLDRKAELEGAGRSLAASRDLFFIGRNINFPSMLEASLKLKEITYLHSEGYAAGELKHGPLSLIDGSTPVIACCLRDGTYEKMLSNVTEAVARGAPSYIIANDGDDVSSIADHVLRVPSTETWLSPIPVAVATQLLAYYAALELGRPIDKPRNLAKSVTVE